MKWTVRGRYSVKALLDLALLDSGQLASVRAIAARQRIPAPFLEKLLGELRQAGLVSSQRGAHGGYRLAKSPRAISLVDILTAVGERIEPLPEPVSLSSDESGPDPQAEDWVMQAVWQRVSKHMLHALQSITLEDLYFDARSRQAAETEATEYTV